MQGDNQANVIQENRQSKSGDNFLTILLSILLLIAVSIAGFFAYQVRSLTNELVESRNQNLEKQTPTPEPESTFPMYTEPDSIPSDWKTFKNSKFTFKYPKDAKVDDQQVGIVRASYMGQKQISTGRVQTELFDGYTFSVGDVSSEGSSLAEIYKKHKENFMNVCDPKNISAVTQTKIDGYDALKYSTSCLGDFTNYIVSVNSRFYDINILVTGDDEDYPKYEKLTDQILSTFKFTD